jgi:hypothetical protein
MAVLAIPKRWDEGSSGNARASRTRPSEKDGIRASRLQTGWLERSATRKFVIRVRPIPMPDRAFVFSCISSFGHIKANGVARSIRQTDHRPENFGN